MIMRLHQLKRTALTLTALAASSGQQISSVATAVSSSGDGSSSTSAAAGRAEGAALRGAPASSCNASSSSRSSSSSDKKAPRRVRLELVADVVCPWCYIGHARLRAASRMAADAGIALQYVHTPFILRRHLPKAGVDKTDMFVAQFGSLAAVRQKYAGISRAATTDGLCFDPDGQLAGNSEDAHRLLLWANDRAQPHHGERFEALLEEMFLVYNCPSHRGQRIWLGDHEGLVAAAGAAGLPEKDAAAVLQSSSDYAAALEDGLARAAQLGAHSVPLMAIGGNANRPAALLSGAVSADELFAALEKAAEQ